jgi:phage/plasmid-associated DNA primase
MLHIYGPGGTGKTVLALVATALVGKEKTVTTSLRALNSEPFEVINLQSKRLILLSDSEDYRGDLSILKQLVGADALRGRRKYHQGAVEVVPEALVLMVSNPPIRARDTSNALARRIRAMYANNPVPKAKRETLLAHDGNQWKGVLAPELPGIYQWAVVQRRTQRSRRRYWPVFLLCMTWNGRTRRT